MNELLAPLLLVVFQDARWVSPWEGTMAVWVAGQGKSERAIETEKER